MFNVVRHKQAIPQLVPSGVIQCEHCERRPPVSEELLLG
jgi:hypothetical protein